MLWIVIIYNSYSRIVLRSLKLLKCINLDDTETLYLEADPDIICWKSYEHRVLLLSAFLPSFLIWCIVWPLIILFALRKRSHRLKYTKIFSSTITKISFLKKEPTPEILESYMRRKQKIFKFLTMDYKRDFYYWEIFFYSVNLILSALVVGTSRFDPLSQGGCFIAVFLILMMITESKQPFFFVDINKTQVNNAFLYTLLLIL